MIYKTNLNETLAAHIYSSSVKDRIEGHSKDKQDDANIGQKLPRIMNNYNKNWIEAAQLNRRETKEQSKRRQKKLLMKEFKV